MSLNQIHPAHVCRNLTALKFVLLLFSAILLDHSASAQGVLTNGYMHQGTIAPIGNTNIWTFSANTGDRIVLRVGITTNVLNFNAGLRVYGPNGVLLGSNVSTTAANEAAVTATNSGTFTVVVDDVGSNATGTYRLTLAKSPGAITVSPGDEGGPMTNGVMHTGSLPVGDLDLWSFIANTGDRLVIRVGITTNVLNFNAGLRVYGPDGALLGSDVSTTAANEVAVTVTNSGTFTVVVGESQGTEAGDYRLTLAKSPGAITVSPGDEGGPLTTGVMHTGSLPVGDLDLWSFSASIGDRIVLRVGITTNVVNFNAGLRVYGPDGALLGSDVSTTAANEVAVTVTNSGTFTVVVGESQGTEAGDYRLTLAKSPGAITVSPGDEGGPMTNGVMHTGSLPVGDLDLWSFSASIGDRIVLRVGITTNVVNFNAGLRVYGPDGALLGSDVSTTAANEVAVTVTNSGTFTVVVGESQGTEAGDYRLTLAKSPGAITVSPGDEGGPMTNGVMHTGSLPVGDLDLWSFSASIGDRIVLRVGITTNVLNFNAGLRVYGPDGALLGSDVSTTDANEVAVTVTNSGMFTVVVGDVPGTEAGDYRLTLAKSPGAITVSPGDEGGPMTNGFVHSGTIDVGDLDVWTFNACDGDGIVLQITKLTGGTGFTPAMRLYAPNGTLLKTASGATSAQISTNAPFLGNYTLVVGDNASGAGTYQLFGTGVSTGLILCKPLINGTNLVVRSVGGPAGSNYVLFSATNITLPLNNWTPLRTNQFGSFGEFSVTNLYSASVTQQFFRVRTP